VHVGHFSYFEQHAKDGKNIRISKVLLTLVTKKHSTQFLFAGCHAEHFAPLFEQIAKLDEALYNIQFEQHWLEAQTDRQAICKYFLLPSP